MTQSPTIADLIDRAQTLILLLDEESDRLLTERPSALDVLIARKQMLTNEFNHAVQQLLNRRDMLNQAPLEDRQQLRATLDLFDRSIMRNGAILLKLKRHSEGLIETIAREVNPEPPSVYTPGTPARRARTTLAMNTTV